VTEWPPSPSELSVESMSQDAPILLVEDDPVDVLTVRRAFKAAGIPNPLLIAGNGREALELLRGGRSEERRRPRPGIVLLDLNLPRMNGFEFLAQLKEDRNLRRIPVVVLTTSDQASDIRQSYDLGAVGYVVKPIDFAEFVDAVERIGRYWSVSRVAEPDAEG
jgi:CheY-like chemotaxis protein